VEEDVPGRTYKQVDTCAGEFAAETPYYYSARQSEFNRGPLKGDAAAGELVVDKSVDSVVVVGGGPIRIGQGVEFDYCSVHAIQALRASSVSRRTSSTTTPRPSRPTTTPPTGCSSTRSPPRRSPTWSRRPAPTA